MVERHSAVSRALADLYGSEFQDRLERAGQCAGQSSDDSRLHLPQWRAAISWQAGLWWRSRHCAD